MPLSFDVKCTVRRRDSAVGTASYSSCKSFSICSFTVFADTQKKQFVHRGRPIQVKNPFHQCFRVPHFFDGFFPREGGKLM